jgi:DNA polymerase-3 subunit delta'
MGCIDARTQGASVLLIGDRQRALELGWYLPAVESPGGRTPLEELRRAWRAGQVHGAYLLEGPPGTGKRETALAFAALLLRGDERARVAAMDGDVLQPLHPDLKLVEPDGAFVKIDQIRALQRELSLAANEGGWRVGIVLGAEHLRTEAANCLLKTLEEPPRDTTVLLVTTVAQRLPATVRSRTTRLRFSPAPEREVASALVGAGLDQDDARMVAALSLGSLDAAVAWAEANVEEAREMRGRIASVADESYAGLLDFAEGFRGPRGRERLDLFLDVHHVHARERMEDALRQGDPARAALWIERADAAERARLETIRRNLNPQLVVEGLLLDLRRAALR